MKIYNNSTLCKLLKKHQIFKKIGHNDQYGFNLLFLFVIKIFKDYFMKFKVSEENNISTIFLNGEIDMEVVDEIRDGIFPLIDSGKEVHINMKDVQYMDLSGISMIIESRQRAKEKNKCRT